jgi:hypothetical protein
VKDAKADRCVIRVRWWQKVSLVLLIVTFESNVTHRTESHVALTVSPQALITNSTPSSAAILPSRSSTVAHTSFLILLTRNGSPPPLRLLSRPMSPSTCAVVESQSVQALKSL